MGTRSRLIIYRRTGPPIYLWMHWDGYFSGVGDDLCKQIKLLLEKYTIEQIHTMLDALDLKKVEEYQDFKTEDLIAFIEGKTTYGYDDCSDIAYEYELDFTDKSLSGKGYEDDEEVERTLKFEQIKYGVKLTDEVVKLKYINTHTVVTAFAMLSDDEKKEALDRITAMMS
jgi:hypothetical protein